MDSKAVEGLASATLDEDAALSATGTEINQHLQDEELIKAMANLASDSAGCAAGVASAPSVPSVPADGAEQPSEGAPAEKILELPPCPANFAGDSRAKGKYYTCTVSNKAGYMCSIHAVAEWPVPPIVPFLIFTHPDNSRLFRDIQRVGRRNVLKTEPKYKEVEVEQMGDIQVLWMRRTYTTWLRVQEDLRDDDCLRIVFSLLRSDVLGRFQGDWTLQPVTDPASGAVVGCRCELHQDVLPKGMPAFVANLPVLGGLLRGVSVRAVTRVLDDVSVAIDKIRKGMAAGRSPEAMLCELCGPVAEAAHANGAVASFAFDAEDDDEEEEEEKEEEGGQEREQEEAVVAAAGSVGSGVAGALPEGGLVVAVQALEVGEEVPAGVAAACAELEAMKSEGSGSKTAVAVEA